MSIIYSSLVVKIASITSRTREKVNSFVVNILASNSHGGCGLGDPIERDPELIVQDIQKMLASLQTYKKVYCVSIDPENLKVDYNKTNKIRDNKRRERLSQGIPAIEYIKSMVEKRKKRQFNDRCY